MSYSIDQTQVTKNGLFLQFIKNQTEEICLEAVKEDGWALRLKFYGPILYILI